MKTSPTSNGWIITLHRIHQSTGVRRVAVGRSILRPLSRCRREGDYRISPLAGETHFTEPGPTTLVLRERVVATRIQNHHRQGGVRPQQLVENMLRCNRPVVEIL